VIRSNVEDQVRKWTEALQAAHHQLAQSEHELQTLQVEYRNLLEQLAAERARSERLASLAERFGVR
jgi:septal ring factor EnvC (AmiA/AmiB activator)